MTTKGPSDGQTSFSPMATTRTTLIRSRRTSSAGVASASFTNIHKLVGHTMPTSIEYALLSANVYGNSPALVRSPQNTLPVPDGWTDLHVGVDGVLPTGSTATGFMASAYQRGNEIVISY